MPIDSILKIKNKEFNSKSISIIIICMFILSSIFALFIIENNNLEATATTHYVGGSGGGNYSTIQAAINNASIGDTVFVYSGTYFEHVFINKSLNLIGESRGNTTIKGNGSTDVISVSANGVMIKGFRVRNSGKYHLNAGIKLHNVRECQIIGNNASYNGFSGIILMSAKENIIRDNILTSNNGSGLMLRYSSAHNAIINNTINNNCLVYYHEIAGLHIIYYSNNNIISGNTINNNINFGISIFNSDNIVMRNNKVSGHKNGIHFLSTNKGHEIYLNEFTNNTNQVNGTSSYRSWNSPIKLSYVYNNSNFTNYLGNYWDDYSGYDNNSDGIGDSPYNIGIWTEKDRYPLIKSISHYQIIPSSTKANLVEIYSNSTNKTVSITTQKATLNATITGDLNGSINLTYLQLVKITSGPFAGSGFFRGIYRSNIEHRIYEGHWQGSMFYNSTERRYYLKGTFLGGVQGITDGYLEESSKKSGKFDIFNSTSIISHLRFEEKLNPTFAQLKLNGTSSVHSSHNSTSEIYILQALFKGNATGYYNKSLSVVLTHVRINNKSHEYYGFGFSTISYVSTWGSGSGWTYDRIISTRVTNLTGFFTKPLWGIVFGILNETGIKRTLSITIIRLDLGSPPAPIVKVEVWGPRRASPGQKINYFIRFMNIGLKKAYNTEIVLVLSSNVTYLSNTHYGVYNNITHSVTWKQNISVKSKNLVSVKCKIKWGLTLGTNVSCNVYIRDYLKNVTLASDTWKIFLTLAVDPNMKSGPEGNVTAGQRLSYKIEFENIGSGIAYGVYFTDTLSEYLDASTLKIGPVISAQDGSVITSTGIYDPAVRTISWFAGEVGPGCGGYANISINVRADASPGTEILNYGTVYFPSVPEITRTNGIVSIVKTNQGPQAVPGKNIIAQTLQSIIFNGSSSFDPDGVITSYTWDFGDGTIGHGKIVSHFYLDDGDYTVTLTVMDDNGVSDSKTIIVKVLNRHPIATLEVDSKDIQLKEIIFNATASLDLDGIVSEYYFDFGDGINSGWIQTPIVTHKFSDGTKIHTINLKVRDDDGAINKNKAEVKIAVNTQPIPKLMVDPIEAYTYSDIVCSGESSTDSDGYISSYYFDFGDGEFSGWINTATISHQYTDGTKKYTISLMVKDNNGALSDEISVTEILIKNRKPIPSLMVEESDIYVFDEVVFDASGSNDLDGAELEYYFDFGDGSNSGWTTDHIIEHSYINGPQDYSVELIVKDSDDEIASTVVSISVKNRVPDADAGSDQNVEVNQVVNFDGSGSYDPDGGVLTFNWDFGDGTITEWSNSDITTHVYTHPGDYTVTLSVSDGTLMATDTCAVRVKDVDSKKDTDGDGIADVNDAFPNDAAASVDSDGDNYPDDWNPGMSETDSTTGLELDEFPNDPARHGEDKSADQSSENIYLMVIIIISITIIIIVNSLVRNIKNKRIRKPFDSAELIRNERDAIINGDVISEPEIFDNELWTDLKLKYQNGKISEETYRLLEQEKLQYESRISDK